MNITRIDIYNTNKNPKSQCELESVVDEVLNSLPLSVIQACIKKTQKEDQGIAQQLVSFGRQSYELVMKLKRRNSKRTLIFAFILLLYKSLKEDRIGKI
ncbi:unnamed protein product [Rotaria socialis]